MQSLPLSSRVFSFIKEYKPDELGCVILATAESFKVVQPPLPIKFKFYRCDKQFHLDQLFELYKTHPKIGVALITGDEVECWIYEGPSKKLAMKLSIYRIKSHKKGGQSAQRFNRIQQSQVAKFISDSAELISHCYFDYTTNKSKIVELIVISTGGLGKQITSESLYPNAVQLTSIDNLDLILSVLNGAPDYQNEITNLITTSLELLVYGAEEIITALRDSTLKKVYVLPDYPVKITDIEVIVTDNQILRDYGGCIGIKYY